MSGKRPSAAVWGRFGRARPEVGGQTRVSHVRQAQEPAPSWGCGAAERTAELVRMNGRPGGEGGGAASLGVGGSTMVMRESRIRKADTGTRLCFHRVPGPSGPWGFWQWLHPIVQLRLPKEHMGWKGRLPGPRWTH